MNDRETALKEVLDFLEQRWAHNMDLKQGKFNSHDIQASKALQSRISEINIVMSYVRHLAKETRRQASGEFEAVTG